MSLSSFSVRRGVTVSMAYAIIAGFGAFSLTQLKLDLYPDISFPMVLVLTSYTGANPDDIETLVTSPIEGAVVSVEGIEEISSDSKENVSVVTAKFAWGSDMDQAETDVRRALDMIQSVLPDDADKPLVFALDPSMQPIVMMMVTGPYPLDKLREIAEKDIKPRLERIDGIATAEAAGGLEREIHVILDPRKLESFNLDVSAIQGAIFAENQKYAGGTIEQGRLEFTIDTVGKYQSVDEIRQIVVGARRTATGSEPVRLRDVAQVDDSFAESTRILETNGEPAVWMLVRKQSGANTAQSAQAVVNALPEISKELGGDLEFDVFWNQADIINDSISNLSTSALAAIVITFFTLLVMLRSFRASIIVATAIPLSVVATFSVMQSLDMTLNVISMAGLALAVGMLVDNAIVVLENIFRLREEGLPIREAAVKGAAQVGLAVTASTLTTVAVFFPILFVPGIAGMLFRDMSITICVALGVSLAVSLTFVPLGASRLLGRAKSSFAQQDTGDRGSWLQRVYGRVLDASLRARWLVVLAVLGVVAGTVALYIAMPTEFIAQSDESQLRVTIETPVGSSLDEAYIALKDAAARIEKVVPPEERKLISLDVGTGTGFVAIFSKGAHAGSIRVPLVKVGQRARSQKEIESATREALRDLPGVKVTVGNQFSLTGGSGDAEIQIRGHDLAASRRIGLELREKLLALPEMGEVVFSMEDQKPQVRVRFDREKMGELGLSTNSVGRAISAYFQGAIAGRYSEGGDEYNILVRYAKAFRSSVEYLRDMPLVTPTGSVARLSSFASVQESLGPVSITRLNQERVTRLNLTFKPTFVNDEGVEQPKDLGTALGKVEKILEATDWPEHFSYKVAGSAEDFQESFMYLGLALVLSIFLVYMVMASQFESFRQPFIILFTVPLAGIGVVLMFTATGDSLDVSGLIGLIMLVGVVVNNGIVLVDAANQIRESERLDRIPAVAKAARTRLRPVLMTSFTTIFGMVPLALKIGEGAETWAGLARAMIGGMSSGTFLTLFVVPTVYSFFAPRKIKFVAASSSAEGTAEATAPKPTEPSSEPSEGDAKELQP